MFQIKGICLKFIAILLFMMFQANAKQPTTIHRQFSRM